MPSRVEHGRRARRRIALAGAAVLASMVAACGGDDQSAQRPAVEGFGPVVGDAGAVLGDVLREASADTAVELRYVGVTSFNGQLEDRLARGDRPGVALLPQPGLLHDLTDRDIVVPLPDDVADRSGESYPTRLADLISTDGTPEAVWFTIDVKGLVWYQPDELEARGLRVPTTLDDLGALSNGIRSTGVAPWCLTMEAGSSTGWVGTDWVEDYVLRRLGPTVYARWTSGALGFDSPEIASVFAELDALLRTPGAVVGGQRAILTVPWERSADLVSAPDPTCLLTHQGDFLRREFPTATSIGPTGAVDFFQLPGTSDDSRPLLVGGMLAAPMDDTPEVGTAIDILSGVDVAERLDRSGVFLSPHLGVDPNVFDDDPTSARLLDLVNRSTEIEFDGSDLMPAAVGTGTFWSGMQAFFASEQIDTILADIDAGWPETVDG